MPGDPVVTFADLYWIFNEMYGAARPDLAWLREVDQRRAARTGAGS